MFEKDLKRAAGGRMHEKSTQKMTFDEDARGFTTFPKQHQRDRKGGGGGGRTRRED